ncbi:MAG TPA: thiamine phosphate synthase [Firmicutes bacterium]|nr:thiamine phosphate synthase [Bacillota bacterium]
MKPDRFVYSLYLIASSESGPDPLRKIMKAVDSGVTMVQLREKILSSRDFYNRALSLKKRLEPYRIPLIINDRADIALAVEADGVHLGQSDLPLVAARSLLGPEKIIGASAGTLETACRAAAEGCDYIGAGALFSTMTKHDAKTISCDTVELMASRLSVPIIAIGGITPEDIPLLLSLGISGVAVSSAILGSENIEAAVSAFRHILGL